MEPYHFSDAMSYVRTGRWTPIGDTVIFWSERRPEDDAEPIVFLHGIPTWSYLWREVIEETGSAYRSIALDLPGFGRSDKSSRHPFRVSALAETVEQFLDHTLGDSQPAHLVVHDLGALVGAELIHRNPERYLKLVVANTSLRAEAWSGTGLLKILEVPYLGDISMLMARPWMLRLAMQPFVADPDARTPERVAGYWYPFEHGFGRSLARLFREGAFEPDDFPRWRTALGEFPGDAYVIWGGRDPAFTPDESTDLKTLLPSSDSFIFDVASHFLPEERPRAFGRRVKAFLSGVDR